MYGIKNNIWTVISNNPYLMLPFCKGQCHRPKGKELGSFHGAIL